MSKKITNLDNRKYTPDNDGQGNANLKLNTSMETLIALSDLRNIILSSAVNLVRLIDTYTTMKEEVTGIQGNTISEFRDDALTVATAAANEMVNSCDSTFSEEDANKALRIIEALKIKDDTSKKQS